MCGKSSGATPELARETRALPIPVLDFGPRLRGGDKPAWVGGWILGWLLACCPVVSAQSFSVDRFVLSGGGGTSTNSQFSLTAVIGQPDAGVTLTNLAFQMEGGFWSVAIVVQTPGAPALRISVILASGTLVLSWPLSEQAYVVESSPVVGGSAVWTTVSAPVQVGSQNRFSLLAAPPGQRFYRLRQLPPPVQ